MFGSSVLEVAIGLVFVYLLLSLVCSAAKEGLEALIKKRAIDLEKGIRELLADRLKDPHASGLAKKLYEHPLIDSLFAGTFDQQKAGLVSSGLPSYIPAQNFALALIDILMPAPSMKVAPAAAAPAQPSTQDPLKKHELDRLLDSLDLMADGPVKRALRPLVLAAGDDLDQARRNIEAWFNSAMDRVAGWYKRWCQWVLFILGLLLAGILNADTLRIGDRIVQDPALRQAVVAAAERESAKIDPSKPANPAGLKNQLEQIRDLGLPLGWDRAELLKPLRPGNRPPADPVVWFQHLDWLKVCMKLVGLLLTALAISLGAPFWFDVLNKFMFVRSTIKPEDKSQKEKGKS
jgi:hypothetical protein